MELDNHRILYSINHNNNMGIIVNNGLKNSTVRQLCTHSQNKNYVEIKKIQMEFSRFIGYCILFRNTENIDQYMLLEDKDAQTDFIKKQIAKKLEMPEQEIVKRKEEIIQFAFDNFKKNGYVFHAANSLQNCLWKVNLAHLSFFKQVHFFKKL